MKNKTVFKKSDYPELYKVISKIYKKNKSENIHQFTLPDLRGYFLRERHEHDLDVLS